MKLNPRSLLAAVVACSLALPGAVMADKRGHGHDYGRSYDSHRGHHYDRHSDRHHYRGHGDRHVTRHYRYKGHDDDDDLLLGLVVGGVLGYALNGATRTERHDTYYYSEPRPYRNALPATETYSYSGDTCLQEREYTTTVQIGGRNVEAYGTACLQPDGSWKRGPAEPVSY